MRGIELPHAPSPLTLNASLRLRSFERNMTRNLTIRPNVLFASAVVLTSLSACSGELTQPDGSGAAPAASGGITSSGGAPAGGASSGGAASGGAPAAGGTSSGGAASGGVANSGGSASGGAGTGGGGDVDYSLVENGPTFMFFKKLVTLWNPNNCLGADCHGGTPAHISFVTDDGLYDRLLSADSDDVCLDANDMPMKLVVPGEPENSALIRILKEPCENMGRMPGGECIEGSDCLSAEYIQYLEEWIANGALEEEPTP